MKPRAAGWLLLWRGRLRERLGQALGRQQDVEQGKRDQLDGKLLQLYGRKPPRKGC
ncbi:MAG: hypothetical protein U0570_01030 [Phycisphaerales bacterium]